MSTTPIRPQTAPLVPFIPGPSDPILTPADLKPSAPVTVHSPRIARRGP